jgi:hypothetical protein
MVRCMTPLSCLFLFLIFSCKYISLQDNTGAWQHCILYPYSCISTLYLHKTPTGTKAVFCNKESVKWGSQTYGKCMDTLGECSNDCLIPVLGVCLVYILCIANIGKYELWDVMWGLNTYPYIWLWLMT